MVGREGSDNRGRFPSVAACVTKGKRPLVSDLELEARLGQVHR